MYNFYPFRGVITILDARQKNLSRSFQNLYKKKFECFFIQEPQLNMSWRCDSKDMPGNGLMTTYISKIEHSTDEKSTIFYTENSIYELSCIRKIVVYHSEKPFMMF